MNTDKKMRTSNPPTVIYTQQRKPVVSIEERKRQKGTLREYNIGGGNDAS